MNKQQLRNFYRQKRGELSGPQCQKLDDLLLIRFQQFPIPYHCQLVLSYSPLDHHKEVNTYLFTDYLRFRFPGLQLAYPVANFSDHTMEAVIAGEDTEFVANQFGIAEPTGGEPCSPLDLDIVLVPLLAFDRKGYRVGYGKGFYDRFLPRCRPDVVKIGFSYFDPVGEIEGIDQFDVPLTIGITPKDIYEF